MTETTCQFCVTKDTKTRKKGEACGKPVKDGDYLCTRHKNTKLGKRILESMNDSEIEIVPDDDRPQKKSNIPPKEKPFVSEHHKVDNDRSRLESIAKLRFMADEVYNTEIGVDVNKPLKPTEPSKPPPVARPPMNLINTAQGLMNNRKEREAAKASSKNKIPTQPNVQTGPFNPFTFMMSQDDSLRPEVIKMFTRKGLEYGLGALESLSEKHLSGLSTEVTNDELAMHYFDEAMKEECPTWILNMKPINLFLIFLCIKTAQVVKKNHSK